jgi:DNA-binding HxlR family transcriptional regulator
MQRKSFADMQCPIAHALEHVRDPWGMLVIRDALHGLTRFDDFQRSLGISTSSLTRRLNELVEAGVLERRRYQERPERFEYLLTPAGEDLKPVVVALGAWGMKHDRPETVPVHLVDADTGDRVDPVLIDRRTGKEISDPSIEFRPGPDATDAIRARMAGHRTTPTSSPVVP